MARWLVGTLRSQCTEAYISMVTHVLFIEDFSYYMGYTLFTSGDTTLH